MMTGDLKNIQEAVQRFDPISLGEMDTVKLMNRTDTKFIFHTFKLKDLLKLSRDQYRVLQIGEIRTFQYNSLYYDTENLDLYLAHHNGNRPRFKVRFREYVDTDNIFLEVKKKTNKDRTRKCRMEVGKTEMELSEKSIEYVQDQSPLKASLLRPALWTIFQRVTLVGKNSAERITIDHDLSFRYRDQEKRLPFLTICEVKRDSFAGHSAIIKNLNELSIHPGNSSKYCLGTVLLKDQVKQNSFKRNLLKLKRLENDYRSYPAAG
jgi:SPX domain protein involved in polyphosphate accumulation